MQRARLVKPGLGACVAVAACVVVCASGCPRTVPEVDINATFPPGQEAVVERVTPMVQRQPLDQALPSAWKLYRGAPGRALPKGAVVVRAPLDASGRAPNDASDKVDPRFNAWIYVEALTSPVQGQDGWKGWVHSDALRAVKAGSAKAPAAPEGFQTGKLRDTAKLCDAALSSARCNAELHPSLLLRKLSCDGEFVEIDAWDPSGMYTSGFVQRDAFLNDPCAVAPGGR